jgi:hypothetical protein
MRRIVGLGVSLLWLGIMVSTYFSAIVLVKPKGISFAENVGVLNPSGCFGNNFHIFAGGYR